jgi:hypothetical protein
MNAIPTDTAPLSPVLTAIHQMTEDELRNLYREVRERLRIAHLLETDNLNVVSVRLPLATYDHVRQLALLHQQTRSDIIRDAVEDYCSRTDIR